MEAMRRREAWTAGHANVPMENSCSTAGQGRTTCAFLHPISAMERVTASTEEMRGDVIRDK